MSRKKELKDFAPPGVEIILGIRMFVMGIVGSALYSMIFLSRFSNAKKNLYTIFGGKRVLIEGAKLPEFDSLVSGCMVGFLVVIIVMLGVMIYNYAYHHMNGKPIYLMKRIPNKLERHIRCLCLPAVGMVTSTIFMVVMWSIYKLLYVSYVPLPVLPL